MVEKIYQSIKNFINYGSRELDSYQYSEGITLNDYIEKQTNQVVDSLYSTGANIESNKLYKEIFNNQYQLTEEEKSRVEKYRKADVNSNRDHESMLQNKLNQYRQTYGYINLGGQQNYNSNTDADRYKAFGFGYSNPSYNNQYNQNPYMMNIGYNSYYDQKTDYKQGAVYNQYMNNNNTNNIFRNTYSTNSGIYTSSYYNNNRYYQNPYEKNTKEVYNFMSKIITKDGSNTSAQEDPEFESIKKELYNRYIKYGTSDLGEIRLLQDFYKITDDKLNTEEHRNALLSIKEDNEFMIEEQICDYIEENIVPQIRIQCRNNISNYMDRNYNPDITIDELNQSIVMSRIQKDRENHRDMLRKRYINSFKKYNASEECKAIHNVGSIDQMLNNYGSPNNETLAKFLHEKREEISDETFLSRLSANKMNSFEITEKGLNVEMKPEYIEAIKMREAKRALAYKASEHNHQ